MAEKTTAFTGPVVVGLNDKKGEIRLTDGKDVNEAKYLAIKAPDVITSDTTLTFPNGAGTAGQILSTDGNGTLNWVNDSAGNPDGSNGQVQVNDNGTFGAISEGTSGQVLTSNGAGSAPTFQTASGADPVTSSLDVNSPKTIKLNADYPTGANNVVLGDTALNSVTSGGQNTAIGSIALTALTTASFNTAIGYKALENNISGTKNTVIGSSAAQNTTGSNNVAVGVRTLFSNTSGNKNTAVGEEALVSGTSGSENVAIGLRALRNNTANQNTAVGTTALFTNTNGTGNTAVGFNAGVSSTANNNTFVGANAGDAITFFGDNTAVGFDALTQYNAQSATAIGSRALKEGGGSNNIGIGPNSGYNTNGSSNVFIGQNTGFYAYNSRENVVVGTQSFNGTNGNMIGSTVLGFQACTASNQSGTNNTIIGRSAQPSTTSVSNEITLGDGSISTLRCQVTSITALSDARDKKDVEDANIGLDFINDLRPVKFVWDTRDGAKKDIKEVGFIAQELDEVQQKHGVEDHLQLVLKNNPDKLEASQGKLIPILVQAIKDLKKELDELKKD